MVNETVERSNGFLKGRLKRLPPCVTSSSGIQPSQIFSVRTFSLLGEKGEGVVFSRPLRALSVYVLLAYWEKRERGLCSLGP